VVKVDFSVLPKYKGGPYDGRINWKESIGIKLAFIVEDLHGQIEILDYDTHSQKLLLKYNNQTAWLLTNVLLKSQIRKFVGRPYKLKKKFVLREGEVINNIKILQCIDIIGKPKNHSIQVLIVWTYRNYARILYEKR